jgi:hypothetical protein
MEKNNQPEGKDYGNKGTGEVHNQKVIQEMEIKQHSHRDSRHNIVIMAEDSDSESEENEDAELNEIDLRERF